MAYVREYPNKILPDMVQYIHFRILKFPLDDTNNIFCMTRVHLTTYSVWFSDERLTALFSWRINVMALLFDLSMGKSQLHWSILSIFGWMGLECCEKHNFCFMQAFKITSKLLQFLNMYIYIYVFAYLFPDMLYSFTYWYAINIPCILHELFLFFKRNLGFYPDQQDGAPVR